MKAWALLTATGLMAGIASALLLGESVEKMVGMVLVTPVLTGLVGSILGAAQYFHLRRRVRASLWIAASAAGLGIGLAAAIVLVEQTGRLLAGGQVRLLQLDMLSRAMSFAVVGFVSGASLGLAQAIVLKRLLPGMRRWPILSGLALGLSFTGASLLVDSLLGGLSSPLGLPVFLASSGLLFGALTARQAPNRV